MVFKSPDVLPSPSSEQLESTHSGFLQEHGAYQGAD